MAQNSARQELDEKILTEYTLLKIENVELKELLKYYSGQEDMLESAGDILEKAIDGQNELLTQAQVYDDYVFDKESEMARRETNIEREETRLKRIAANNKHVESEKKNIAQMKKEYEAKIRSTRNKWVSILMGVTGVYTIILIMIYLSQ